MSWEQVQALLLRPSHASAVVHLVLRVTPGRGGEALQVLKTMRLDAPLTLGDAKPAAGIHCTWGFTYRGLEALGMPDAYLRIFSRLAPAFKQGAPARAAQLGDTGPSASSLWHPAFGQEDAHVVVTLHGDGAAVDGIAKRWSFWHLPGAALVRVGTFRGDRLDAPAGEKGQWVHFGVRDALVDHHIVGVQRALQPAAETEMVPHAPGEFLLGHRNDRGANPFNLPIAPDEVRDFFHDSSFGVLRPMAQDVAAFEAAVKAWVVQARAQVGPAVSADWVKAKLSGRWPNGQAVRPGQLAPVAGNPPAAYKLDFAQDAEGTGCPWSSHVRRMDARGHAGAPQRPHALLRRGVPFGAAPWSKVPVGTPAAAGQGMLGLFFCGSLEEQFELLLGQWANGSPPARPATDAATDPIAGQHTDPAAAAIVPLPAGGELALKGFGAWTRTLGTAYTWHPTGEAIARILAEKYVKEDDDPWL
jgi:hypothetical protein